MHDSESLKKRLADLIQVRVTLEPANLSGTYAGVLDWLTRFQALATDAIERVEQLEEQLRNAPCDPPEACKTHGRCWTHSEEGR